MTIVVAGATGLAGSAIVRAYEKTGKEVIGINRSICDLLDRDATIDFIKKAKPAIVIDAAAKVGGIGANNAYPVEFLADNLRIQSNLMEAAHAADVEKFIFLGSSCIYPRDCAQPIKEEYLLTGPLEETNSAYAIAKIAGIELIKSFRKEYDRKWISLMPTNLYGPNDNFDEFASHVPAALMRKFHEAKINNEGEVVVWGTGTPRREFMHVDDMARACWYMLDQNVGGELINIGTGEDITIAEFAALMAKVVGYEGKIVYDSSKPDGTARKLLDVSKAHSFGWRHQIQLEDGLRQTYAWFVDALAKGEVRGY